MLGPLRYLDSVTLNESRTALIDRIELRLLGLRIARLTIRLDVEQPLQPPTEPALSDLEDAYAEAWEDWHSSSERRTWEGVAEDGLP